jgi:hypothetical protein
MCKYYIDTLYGIYIYIYVNIYINISNSCINIYIYTKCVYIYWNNVNIII